MKSAPATEVNPAALDFRKSLLESFAVNETANQLLLSNILWELGTLWRESVAGK